jgi:hypothetical protein
MDSPYVKDLQVTPNRMLEDWISKVLDGSVIGASGKFETCGVGLWVRGPQAPVLLSAVIQDIMIQMESDGVTAIYANVEDYLDWVRQRERDQDTAHAQHARERSLLVLTGVGRERSTEWTAGTVRSLLTRRFEDGLPTLVSSVQDPSAILGEGLGREMFLTLAIMEASR